MALLKISFCFRIEYDMPGSSKNSKRSAEKSRLPVKEEEEEDSNHLLLRTARSLKRTASQAALERAAKRQRKGAGKKAKDGNPFATFMSAVATPPRKSSPPPRKPAQARSDAQGDGKLKRKEPILSIILNQIFWTYSREPSTLALKELCSLLTLAKNEGVLFDKHDRLSLKMLQAWFRSKRFHVRRSLTDYCTKMQESDQLPAAIQFLKALKRKFSLPYLLSEHKVARLDEDEEESESASSEADEDEEGDDNQEDDVEMHEEEA